MNELIIDKYSKLPKELQEQVLDYVDFLLSKYKNKENNAPKDKKSNFGSAKGMIEISDDFDAPLDDFKAYM